MSIDFSLDAEPRSDLGKGASRRLRRTGKVPAVIYGGTKEPQSVSLAHNVMLQHVEHEAFFSHILDITVDGAKEKAVLKDMQWHPFKPVILHMDFQRVDENSIIKVQVPVHFVGEDVAPGVKAGGQVVHAFTSLEVACKAKDLPEFIEVDVAEVELGGAIHLSEIKMPKGVTLVELSHGEGHDQSIVSIKSKGGSADEETTEESEEAAE